MTEESRRSASMDQEVETPLDELEYADETVEEEAGLGDASGSGVPLDSD